MPKPAVIITGAGRGIGLATAERFARRQFRCALVARSADELRAAAEALPGGTAMHLPIAADVALEADADRVVARAREAFGGVQVLVNCAGVAPLGPFEQMSAATFDRLVAVNVRGVFLMCRAVWQDLTRAGGGTIVNVSSVAARDPFAGLVAYGGTKAFVETFTRGIAAQGRAHGIRAFGVAPGAVRTRMLLDLFPDYPADQMLEPDDVAGLIEWLCDPRCDFCSGQTLSVSRAGG